VDERVDAYMDERAGEQLFGRERDEDRIAAFLADLPRIGGPLLLLGEPGVGKSTLLARAGRQATDTGIRVLRTTGMPYKAQPGYSALAQLLRPVAEDRVAGDRDDSGLGGALAVALGFDTGPVPDYDAVARAVAALVTELSRDRPTLLIVDDVHWLDRPSAMVLGLVARWLTSGVGMLCAARPGTDGYFDYGGLPVHDLRPLADAASEALLVHRFPALAPRVRRRLMAEAEGNPLALLELPVALTDSQRVASRTLPQRLPLSRRLQDAFASRVTGLPAAARRLLLIAALEDSGDLQVLRRAVAGRCNLKHLAPAEHAQLVEVDDAAGRLRFRHPLTRAAVVELSSSDQRRSAHRALADAWADTAPERQAWHLAQATVAPDERIACLLEEAAAVGVARGDGPAAVAALLRAADLSPDASARARRLAESAYLSANLTGELHGVPRLLHDARRAAPGTDSMAAAVAGSAYLLNGSGDLDTAHALLSGAIALAPEPYDPADATLSEALHTLMLVSFFSGRPELWSSVDEALGKYAEAPLLLTLTRTTFGDPARARPADLDQLDAAISGLAVEDDPMRIVRVATAAAYLDRLCGCVQPLERVAHGARTGESVVPAINALFLLGNQFMLTGQWERTRRVAAEGLDLCEEYQYPMLAWVGKYVQAYPAAACGDFAKANALTDQMAQWAGPRRAAVVHAYAAHVRSMVALTRGDFEEAYRQASLVAPAGTLPSLTPHALWLILDLVDAAVRIGRREEAQAHAAAARDAGIGQLSPRLRMLQWAACALACDDLDHPGLADAIAVEEAERWPFDLARIRLYHGERLRRAKATTQAREQLTAAVQLFSGLGAEPWAERARQELRACGGAAQVADPPRPGAAALTPQQREIARLAAAGLSNKQIGEKLFLSPRTVSTHLYQVFPKLGVSSRAALRDALEDGAAR
jgi:DNA-binding CsgD family transcriptional regulator